MPSSEAEQSIAPVDQTVEQSTETPNQSETESSKQEQINQVVEQASGKLKQELANMLKANLLPSIQYKDPATVDLAGRKLQEQMIDQAIDGFIDDLLAKYADTLNKRMAEDPRYTVQATPQQRADAFFGEIKSSFDSINRAMFDPGYRRNIGSHTNGLPVFQPLHQFDRDIFAFLVATMPKRDVYEDEPNSARYVELAPDGTRARKDPNLGNQLPADTLNFASFLQEFPHVSETIGAMQQASREAGEPILFRDGLKMTNINPESIKAAKNLVEQAKESRATAEREKTAIEVAREAIVTAPVEAPVVETTAVAPAVTPAQSPVARPGLLSRIGSFLRNPFRR